MQDNTTAHTASHFMNEINQVFGDRVVSRVLWPPGSPDLNPCDFYLWGKQKDNVYVNNPHTLDELKDNIWFEISNITREEICRVAGNIFRRCEAYLQAEARHLEIVLQNKVGFVSGKPAGCFSVSGPPLYGKEAAAVSENNLHIKRTPRRRSCSGFQKPVTIYLTVEHKHNSSLPALFRVLITRIHPLKSFHSCENRQTSTP
jgi:hypothetical protein